MTSAKYLGYVGGAAVAVGVGAALATASQGTAHADTETKSVSSETKGPEKVDTAGPQDKAEKKATKGPGPKLEKRLDKLADDVSAAVKSAPKPKFDTKDAVKNLQKQFATSATTLQSDLDNATATPVKTVKPVTPLADLAKRASETAAALVNTPKLQAPDASTIDADGASDITAAATEWSINPFRPMPPEPVPDDMPALVWNLEQAAIGVFDGAPVVQPFVREGFEAGYRFTQVIPWVNVLVPLTNIAGDFGPAVGGDKNATQRIVNNLLVTTQPVAIAFYGYDQIADLINLEAPAQDLKQWFYATTWDVLDPFGLLHVPRQGNSGLPLSGQSLESSSSRVGIITLAAQNSAITAVADDPLSDPFRADDPDPKGMPAVVLQLEKALVGATPEPIGPYVREGFEAAYRGTQIVPWVNVVVPLTNILPALVQAAQGNTAGSQITINQLLLTTGPASLLYYGYDQAADLLNVENAADELKDEFYTTIWDTLDPTGVLHPVGQSGLETL
jgi:hypothetical protein